MSLMSDLNAAHDADAVPMTFAQRIAGAELWRRMRYDLFVNRSEISGAVVDFILLMALISCLHRE